VAGRSASATGSAPKSCPKPDGTSAASFGEHGASTLDEALALLARREAELAALRTAQQEWMHAVSHDLRAPLRHLLAFNPLVAELLQSASPVPKTWRKRAASSRPWISPPSAWRPCSTACCS
jgi:signal transduction histidine kinase